ncbi:LysR family transcriptional regulator [Candidatus Chlorohelix sp.]|uniref:LysR family transcriptional regulator n=1 Tax=Candidatus Chlorohelix sp. TaxID=3139201 RepID=UPI00304AF1CD
MLSLDLQKLQIFCEVARQRSFTRAAEALYLTQPTVSQQVQALERQIGVRLFERLAKEVYLTEAGKVLYAKAVNLLSQAQETEQAVREAAGISAGRLDLGVGVTLATYVLPELLRRFKLSYNSPSNGAVKFEIALGNTETLAQKLLKNEVDLALVGTPMEPHPLLEIHPFLEDKLIMICSPADGWAMEGRNSVNLSEIGNRTMLIRERGSALQAFASQMLEVAHTQAENYLVMANLEAIKRSVEIGLGVAIIPALSIRRELESGRLHVMDIDGAKAGRTFVYAHHKDKELTRPARAFLEVIKAYAGYSIAVEAEA